jgi:hypothetical protein
VTAGEDSGNVTSDIEDDDAPDMTLVDFVLNEKKLFEVAKCGCYLPKWVNIEWRDQEGGHRYLRCVGMGLSVNGKPTKRRKYGQWYGHRAITLFVENEYAKELNTYKQRQAFGRAKRRAKA